MARRKSDLEERLARVDWFTEDLLDGLTPKQQKFAMAVVEGEPISRAWKDAGYQGNRAQAYTMMKTHRVGVVVDLLRKKHQLEHGIAVAKKRELLMHIASTASTPGESYQPGSAVSAIRTLAEIDGDIRSGSAPAGDVVINISTGLNREPVTVDHE